MKVPHMGWNDLKIDRQHPVLEGISTGDHAYFVHSYAMKVADPADLLAHVDYGGPVTAIVARDTVVGTQFHPEKSQRAGLRLIANFLPGGPEARRPSERDPLPVLDPLPAPPSRAGGAARMTRHDQRVAVELQARGVFAVAVRRPETAAELAAAGRARVPDDLPADIRRIASIARGVEGLHQRAAIGVAADADADDAGMAIVVRRRAPVAGQVLCPGRGAERQQRGDGQK
jgi:hypothetical protein